jgi:RNA polymerase sigma factor (sigma-70 family)
VAGNLRLVIAESNRWRRACRSESEMEELMQFGAIGLVRAAEKYDPTTGYKFSTYAHWWIRQAMGRAAPNISALVYIPSSARDRYAGLTRLIADYEAEHGVRPSIELLSDVTGLSPSKIRESAVIGHMRLIGSLDATARSDEDSSTLGELIAPDQPDLLDTLADQDLQSKRVELLNELVEQLDDKDRETIRDQLAGVPVSEASRQQNLSRARIGQLRLRARQRMCAAAEHVSPHWRELLIAA